MGKQVITVFVLTLLAGVCSAFASEDIDSLSYTSGLQTETPYTVDWTVTAGTVADDRTEVIETADTQTMTLWFPG